MNQDSITNNLKSDSLYLPLYVFKDTTASADSVSDLMFDDYVIKILNDSFPTLNVKPSLLKEKTYIHNRDMVLKPINKSNQSMDWMFLAVVLIFVHIAILFKFFRYRSWEIIRGCFSVKSFEVLSKSSNNIILPAALPFFPLIALLAYFAIEYFEVPLNLGYDIPSIYIYLALLLGVVVVFGVKFFSIHFLCSLFRGKNISRLYLINQLTFLFLEALTLLFPIIFAIFSPSHIQYHSLILSVGLFGILSLFRVIRGLYLVFNFSKFSRVYLFCYLCIVEFLPLLFIVKVLFLK
ncbi:MAG: DUF4271 domain-containing protein [Bacteroidales bacterium]|nr:DUF4271 domain-containing protein [Bacteroidales bacterium]